MHSAQNGWSGLLSLDNIFVRVIYQHFGSIGLFGSAVLSPFVFDIVVDFVVIVRREAGFHLQ